MSYLMHKTRPIKIKNIKYVGEEDVYDIEMEKKPHNFFANDTVSHNSHAVSYAIIAYQCMYLKKYYPIEFMTAILCNNSDEEDINLYMRECEKLKIKVLRPDVNRSKLNFTIDGNSIRQGLSSIKNIGSKAADILVGNSPYKNFTDFISKTKGRAVTKRVVKALIDAGCFDNICTKQSLANYEEIIEQIKKDLKKIELKKKKEGKVND